MFNSGLYQFTAGRLELLYQQLCATTTQALVVMSNVIRPFDLYMLKKNLRPRAYGVHRCEQRRLLRDFSINNTLVTNTSMTSLYASRKAVRSVKLLQGGPTSILTMLTVGGHRLQNNGKRDEAYPEEPRNKH